MITSQSNETIKKLKELYTNKGRKKYNEFIVEGPHLVKEARLAGCLKEIYTIDENLEGIQISSSLMKQISKTDTPIKQIGVCKFINKNNIEDKVLILDSIQDPGNMGTLLRTAKAFNFNTVFLSNECVDIYNDKVIRSSQGAIFKLNFIFGDKVEFIKKLSKTHNVYSTDVNNGIDVREVKNNKLALILGNEGNGVSKEIRDLNLNNLYIKMDNTESLNVAVAGAILMYELNN